MTAVPKWETSTPSQCPREANMWETWSASTAGWPPNWRGRTGRTGGRHCSLEPSGWRPPGQLLNYSYGINPWYSRNNDEAYRVNINEDIKYKTLRDDKILLAAVKSLDSVSLLYTVSDGQHFPLCSVCSKQKCGCFGVYKSEVEAAEGDNVEHYWDRYISAPCTLLFAQ